MACNPTRIELSNAATTTVQITLATDPGDGTTVTLEVDELGIDASATTTSAVASFSITAVSAANNSIWDATIQVGANRPATAEVLVTETNTNQTVGVTIDDSSVTYCAPSAGGGGGSTTLGGLTDVTLATPSSGDLLIYDGDTWYNQPLTPPIDYVYGKSSILAELKTTNAKVMFVGDSISQNGATDFTTLWHAALFAWHPDQWGGAWFRSSASDVGIQTLANVNAITEAETDALPGYNGAFANRTNLRGQYSSVARGGETINSTQQTHQISFQRSAFASNVARPALLERFDDGLQIFEDADGVRRIADGTTTFRFGPMFFGYGTTDIVDSVQLRLTDNGVTPGVYETNALTADADAWTDAAYNEYAVSAAGDSSSTGTILQVVRQTTPADGNYLAIQAVFVGREEGTTISYVGYGGWNVGNHSNAYPNGDEFTLTVGGTPYTSPWSYSDEHITARMATEGTTHLFLHIGANDLDASEIDAGVLMDKIEDLVDRFSGLRSGIKFVFTTIYTTDNDTASIIANREDFNRRLRTFCWGRDDCVCVDLAQYIADTYSTHAAFSSAWLYDDVHPNADGAYAMQSFIWDRVVAAAGADSGLSVVGGTGIDVTTVGTTATVDHQDKPSTGTGYDFVRSISIDALGHVATITADSNVATARESLGLEIGVDVAAANTAVPDGGTTGQVLAKASATDYDTEWVAAGGTGTVTSVGLNVPGGFTVSGTNPITTAGTFEITSTLSGVIKGDGAATFSGDAGLNDLADVNIATGAGNDGDLVYFNNAGGAGDKFKGVARSSIGLSEFDNDLPAVEDSYLMLIESPSDKTYTLDGRVAAARTVTNFYAKTSSGTCTATLKNLTDATTIGTISVTSTGGSAASLSNTGLTANERIAIEISSNSSSADLEMVVEFTQ